MKIRFALPVNATDGPFGEIADVVIDPITRHITHLVVEPHHRHYQARLVPIGLIDLSDDAANVRLDTQQIRALPPVADSDFLPLGEQIDLGDDWDVGIEHVLTSPYVSGPMGAGAWADTYSNSDGTTIDFDRIPKGECEIRRESRVISTDDHLLGIVDGFLADDTHIEGVIVQTGLPGFRHLVVIPVNLVSKVSNDQIVVALDRDRFRRLPPVSELEGAHALHSRLERFEHSMANVAKGLRSRIRSLLHRDGSDDSSAGDAA